jgi:hypothetical protein
MNPKSTFGPGMDLPFRLGERLVEKLVEGREGGSFPLLP